MTLYDTTKMHPLDAMRDKMRVLEAEVMQLKEANSKLASSDLLQSYEATQAENAKLRAQLAAAQGQEPVNAMLVGALEEARNGLAWYQAMYPGATDGSGDEAMERIDAALTAAKDGASDV